MNHLALTLTQRKKLEKYLIGMSKRAAYNLAISALSRLDDHNTQKKNLKKTCRVITG